LIIMSTRRGEILDYPVLVCTSSDDYIQTLVIRMMRDP